MTAVTYAVVRSRLPNRRKNIVFLKDLDRAPISCILGSASSTLLVYPTSKLSLSKVDAVMIPIQPTYSITIVTQFVVSLLNGDHFPYSSKHMNCYDWTYNPLANIAGKEEFFPQNPHERLWPIGRWKNKQLFLAGAPLETWWSYRRGTRWSWLLESEIYGL